MKLQQGGWNVHRSMATAEKGACKDSQNICLDGGEKCGVAKYRHAPIKESPEKGQPR